MFFSIDCVKWILNSLPGAVLLISEMDNLDPSPFSYLLIS